MFTQKKRKSSPTRSRSRNKKHNKGRFVCGNPHIGGLSASQAFHFGGAKKGAISPADQ
jgi:hypothetical protein